MRAVVRAQHAEVAKCCSLAGLRSQRGDLVEPQLGQITSKPFPPGAGFGAQLVPGRVPTIGVSSVATNASNRSWAKVMAHRQGEGIRAYHYRQARGTGAVVGWRDRDRARLRPRTDHLARKAAREWKRAAGEEGLGDPRNRL